MKIKSSDHLLGTIFLLYLSLVRKTSHIEIRDMDVISDDSMIGFWHGDSYCMQFILRQLSKKHTGIRVIVTADRRGNSIEHMLKHYGAKAIRIPDGFGMRPFFRSLIEAGKEEGFILAAALDGPLGPLHEPKKLILLLAKEANKPLCYIHFKYSRVIRLKHRWDHYVIPLPFSKVIAQVEYFGRISAEELKNAEELTKGFKW
ncbi:MAG: hypothetical protein K0S47_2587 [Herbinix sp.]|jgi:lysophospholipid acyltransferase (LPLAT)-like uncharacterized protein|nr:hypothetical protein [Herbinix sp.]